MTVTAKLNWMAYSELPWRPFLGHQAWSWTTLRRGNVFNTFTDVFCRVFKRFLTFFKFLFERFYIYAVDIDNLLIPHCSVAVSITVHLPNHIISLISLFMPLFCFVFFCVVLFITRVSFCINYLLCRMTNYELLRWLVETPSRDVVHCRMINASRSTVCHYNDKLPRDDNQVWWTLLKMSALGLRPRATFSTSVRHIWMSHSQPCIICIVYANSVYIRPIVNSPACVLSRFNKRKSDSQSR